MRCEPVSASAQQPPDAVERVVAAAAVTKCLLLDPAPDVIHGGEAEAGDVEAVQHPDCTWQGAGAGGVESGRGAVSPSRVVRFAGPLPEPDVRLPPHPALHGLVPLGVTIRLPLVPVGPTGSGLPFRGSGIG